MLLRLTASRQMLSLPWLFDPPLPAAGAGDPQLSSASRLLLPDADICRRWRGH